MLVAGFAAGALATNCWVVAASASEPCVVVDPGIDASGALAAMLHRHRVRPVAVLLTHGHLDHTWAAAEVCGEWGIPAYIHPADRAQIADPWSGLGVEPGTDLFGRTEFAEPDEVRELADVQPLDVAGLSFAVRRTPGHTPGSVIYAVAGDRAPLVFGGDLLFAGSIGRIDLPGGSSAEMARTITDVLLPMDDATVIHPGHGDSTTIARERAGNPFLAAVAGGISL